MNNAIEDIRKSIEEIISETDEAQLLLYTVEEDIQILQKDNAKLRAENTKLKELVGKILNESHLDKSCAECDICDECAEQKGRWKNCLFVEKAEQEARDLGIKVEVGC